MKNDRMLDQVQLSGFDLQILGNPLKHVTSKRILFLVSGDPFAVALNGDSVVTLIHLKLTCISVL